ncbi:MAG: hypothetical protein PHW53_02840 [Patescibacteria group bacterium]|nr:hypothetical protein [Patescibacteria group bacterium]
MRKLAKAEIKEAKKLGRRLSVIGHEQILSFLEKSLNSGRLSHAYLFLGPEDVGKESAARWWLEKILHQGHEGGERHTLENHPDVAVIEREIDEKSKKLKKLISIEQIRDLRDKLSLTSFLNTYKVALIREAGHLSIEAANALLKTLEEPAGKTIIILLADDVARLPATIASRCQIIQFRAVPEKIIYDALRERGAERDEAELLARLAAGSPGKALRLLEDKKLLEEYKNGILDFLRITREPVWRRFDYIDRLVPARGDREEIAKEIKGVISLWRGIMRDALLLALDCPDLMINSWARSEIQAWQADYGAPRVSGFLRSIEAADEAISQNANIKLVLENLLLEF